MLEKILQKISRTIKGWQRKRLSYFCEEKVLVTKWLDDTANRYGAICSLRRQAPARSWTLLRNLRPPISESCSLQMWCRGIDIGDITMVINYDFPLSVEKVVLRITSIALVGLEGAEEKENITFSRQKRGIG